MISLEIAILHYVTIMFPPPSYALSKGQQVEASGRIWGSFFVSHSMVLPFYSIHCVLTDSCSSKLNSLVIEYRIAIYPVVAFVGVLHFDGMSRWNTYLKPI